MPWYTRKAVLVSKLFEVIADGPPDTIAEWNLTLSERNQRIRATPRMQFKCRCSAVTAGFAVGADAR
jgi:hypothetical protein